MKGYNYLPKIEISIQEQERLVKIIYFGNNILRLSQINNLYHDKIIRYKIIGLT